jgi:hypothetical protein
MAEAWSGAGAPHDYLYLASPYTHQHAHIRERRFQQVRYVASQFAREGIPVYSPIVHGHMLDVMIRSGDLSDPHGFWRVQWLPLLHSSAALVVLQIPEWQESRGVSEEIQIARVAGKPVHYLPYHYFTRPEHEASSFIRHFNPLKSPASGVRPGSNDGPDGEHSVPRPTPPDRHP